MKLRWYKHEHFNWYRDSRYQLKWYKSGMELPYTLQVSLDGEVWEDVPYVLEQTEDAKPSE